MNQTVGYQGFNGFDPRISGVNGGGSLALGGGTYQNANFGDVNLNERYNGGLSYGGQQFEKLGPFSRGVKNFSLGAQGVTSLASLYFANEARKQGKEQFGIEKTLANRNVANASLAYNDGITQDSRDTLAGRGIRPGDANYEQALAEITQGRRVDGSPVA